ncbi:hypothetical protein ACMCNP_02825 [Candidatus Acidulodesulfobacterium sp. H_13]|uniref:hypothetical protein n=1 Tax=Candidatus Acidulodesulfobacterium sp. H_13 TaxID=3395470 RepID=UPI003AF907A6
MKTIVTGKLFLFFLVAGISAIALTGCATTRSMQGKPIVPNKVNKIINGTTTKSQLISMLGSPYSIEKKPRTSNTVVYKYRFYYNGYTHIGNEILTASMKKYEQKLDVVIKNGIVIAYSFTAKGNISLKNVLNNIQN